MLCPTPGQGEERGIVSPSRLTLFLAQIVPEPPGHLRILSLPKTEEGAGADACLP